MVLGNEGDVGGSLPSNNEALESSSTVDSYQQWAGGWYVNG